MSTIPPVPQTPDPPPVPRAQRQPTLHGEKIVVPLTKDDITFIKEVASKQLDAATDVDQLKHFAETWWNLCQWEKQRADAIDGKAQMLLGLSSIATALLGSSAKPVDLWDAALRLVAILLFLVTVAVCIRALRVRQYGGFLDREVFEALGAFKEPVGVTPEFTDKDPVKCYLRETALQRWFVYKGFKVASGVKAARVRHAQEFAFAAVITAGLSIAYPAVDSQRDALHAFLQCATKWVHIHL